MIAGDQAASVAGGVSPVWQVVLGLLGGGVLAKVVDALLSRRRGTAETDSVVVKTANEWIATMREDLLDMRRRLSEMDQRLEAADQRLSEVEDERDAYRRRVVYLTDVVRQHQIPVEDWSAPK